MVLRTYLSKNNTIVSGTKINTGKNPISELYYGGVNKGFSRNLMQFNHTNIKKYYEEGFFGDLSKVTHTLKMVNTGIFNEDLLNKNTEDGKERTSSFDLVLFEINESWDEGIGYDYNLNLKGGVISNKPSNWYDRETGVNWGINGVDNSNLINIQHFSDGNENLTLDITSIVNEYILGTKTNNGMALSFTPYLESLDSDKPQYVGFFSRHTQTFHEPYIESKYTNVISDDRFNFYGEKNNKLYLYVNTNNQPTNLDELPIVTIKSENGDLDEFTVTAEQISKGVYGIDVIINESGNFMCEDKWSNIKIGGIERPDITLNFEVKESDDYYNIGLNTEIPESYKMNIVGIKYNEKINKGDVRKIFTNAVVPYTVNHKVLVDRLEYRLFVKEGVNEHTVIDYNLVNKTFMNNYFLLDTESLLPNTYYLDIRVKNGDQIKTTKEILKFDVM